jgi:hypothetical protein
VARAEVALCAQLADGLSQPSIMFKAKLQNGQVFVVGRGHASLLTNLDIWHSEPFTDMWYLLIYYQYSFRELYKYVASNIFLESISEDALCL